MAETQPIKPPSRRGSIEKSERVVEALSERIFVENLLVRLEQTREFNEKSRHYHKVVGQVEPEEQGEVYSETNKTTNYWSDDIKVLGSYDDVVVIPSLSLDAQELVKIHGIIHYEERQLFNLILLRRPKVKLIYVSSMPIDQSIIEYYWKLLPERVPFSEISKRLVLLSVYDDSPRPLSQKLLEKPRLLQRIRKHIRNPESACITCFSSTQYEHELANKLGITLLGNSLNGAQWGTKEGSHQIFDECKLPSPPCTPLRHSGRELAEEIYNVWVKYPHSEGFVIKLNDSFTGEGNAILLLNSILSADNRNTLNDPAQKELIIQKIEEGLKTMTFQSKHHTWETYSAKAADMGFLAEIYYANTVTSPSGQGCIDINGNVWVLSTHEQVLGGTLKQVYQGCRFPADARYRIQIQEMTKKVGECLATKGVIDHFGVDFITFPKPNSHEWEVLCLEINIRQGGTTHPMMTLKLLTDGEYDMATGRFMSKLGRPKYYIASDNILLPELKRLVPQDLIDIFSQHELHFSHFNEKGVVFHLLGAISKYGKVGVTCIADSREEAQHMYDTTVKIIQETAKTAEGF